MTEKIPQAAVADVSQALQSDPGALANVAIRQLWPFEAERLARHLKRLHPEDRWRRFSSAVSDAWLDDYAIKAVASSTTLVKGAFVDGRLCGAAEAWFAGEGDATEAEAAFSLERAYQSRGIGTLLFRTLIRSARNRGARRLRMVCLRDNPRMIALARANSAELSVSPDGVTGEIAGGAAKPFAVGSEFFNESLSYWLTVPIWAAGGALATPGLWTGYFGAPRDDNARAASGTPRP